MSFLTRFYLMIWWRWPVILSHHSFAIHLIAFHWSGPHRLSPASDPLQFEKETIDRIEIQFIHSSTHSFITLQLMIISEKKCCGTEGKPVWSQFWSPIHPQIVLVVMKVDAAAIVWSSKGDLICQQLIRFANQLAIDSPVGRFGPVPIDAERAMRLTEELGWHISGQIVRLHPNQQTDDISLTGSRPNLGIGSPRWINKSWRFRRRQSNVEWNWALGERPVLNDWLVV